MNGVVSGARAESLPRASVRIAALARLELGDVLRSRWLMFCIGLYAVLALAFVGLGTRESTVLGFTGMPRVLLSLTHALVILLPLMALTGTGQVVSRARRDGTLELLFSHPVTRDDYFRAVTLVRLGALLLPLLILLPSLVLISAGVLGQAVSWAFLARSLIISAALLWCFTGIGLAVSVRVDEPDRLQMYLLVIWIAAVAILDFGLVGLMLQWRVPPVAVFVLAGLNPVETARLALLSAADPTLGNLGPVGFFLYHSLGPAWLSLVGVLWPVVVGAVAWTVSARKFRGGDLV